tara:strand:- start:1788 stop:3035 length:1248 start_codon:yes stop_codon:yes gene_type:complete
MASIGTYCFDGTSFSQASSLYTDATLTTLAPDGYYSQGQTVRRQLNGVLLNAQACTACSVQCGSGVSLSAIAGNGIFNSDIDLDNTTGAVVLYFYMGTSVPDGVLTTYDGVIYNRLTAKNNHNGVVLLDGAGATVDYAGILNQASGLPTYVGNQNAALVGSYTNTPGGSCVQGDKPQNYSLISGNYTAQGTYQGMTVVDNQVGYSSDASTIPSPVFTLVVPKASVTPTNINLKVYAPLCSTSFAWEIGCPTSLPTFSASVAQSTITCAAATTSYYFIQNATGTTVPFTVATNTTPEIGNWVFEDVNGSVYLNDTTVIQYYIIGNSTYIGVRSGVVVSVGGCTANYTIDDCDTASTYTVANSFSFALGDVVQYQVGTPGAGLIYCGTVTNINSGGTADATLYSATAYSCGDAVHCA